MGNVFSCNNKDGSSDLEFSRLHRFCIAADELGVRHSLQHGLSVNQQDENGRTPLFFVSTLGESLKLIHDRAPHLNRHKAPSLLRIAGVLLEARADPNIGDFNGVTPLHLAAWADSVENCLLMKKLLEFGADIAGEDNKGRLPIHYAFLDRKIHPKTGERLTLNGNKHQQNNNQLSSQKKKKKKKKTRSIYDSEDDDEEDEEEELDNNAALFLLKKGSLIMQEDEEGNLPIFEAIETGNKDFIFCAIELFPSMLDARRPTDNATPLICAVECIDGEIFDKILSITPDLVNEMDNCHRTALMCAVGECSMDKDESDGEGSKNEQERMALALIEFGANYRKQDDMGWEPLHRATYFGMAKVVNAILQRGGKEVWLSRCGENGYNALSIALSASQMETVRILLDFATLNHYELDVWDCCVVHSACNSRDEHSVKTILGWARDTGLKVNLEKEDKKGRTATHIAALKRNSTALMLLLEHEADAGAVDNQGNTPLHLALATYEDESATICSCVELLISAGATVNAVNESGRTALHMLARSGLESLEVFDIMLMHDADPNVKDNEGITPLAETVSLFMRSEPNSRVEAIRRWQARAMLAFGGDSKLIDWNLFLDRPKRIGRSFSDNSSNNNDNSESNTDGLGPPAVLSRKLSVSASTKLETLLAESPLFCSAWIGNERRFSSLLSYADLDNGQLSSLLDSNGNSLLHAATASRNIIIIQKAIELQCDINLQNKLGFDPLHLCLNENPHLHIHLHSSPQLSQDIEIVQLMINAKANVNQKLGNSSGNTPLHTVLQRKQPELLKMLIAAKADVDQPNNSGVTPKVLARSVFPDAILTEELEEVPVPAFILELQQWETMAVAAPEGFLSYIDVPWPDWFSKRYGRARRFSTSSRDSNPNDDDASADGCNPHHAGGGNIANIWHTGVTEWQVLGVPRNASREETKAVFRDMVRFWHRDKFEQKFSEHLVPDERDSILKHVQLVAACVTEAWKRMAQKRGWGT